MVATYDKLVKLEQETLAIRQKCIFFYIIYIKPNNSSITSYLIASHFTLCYYAAVRLPLNV